MHGSEALLLGHLLAGQVMFFAGSGVSLASGLPTVEDVRGATIDALAPSMRADRRAYCAGLQAEQFYSVLLEATRTDDCLAMWRVLSPGAWAAHADCEYHPRPNFVHLFMVACSWAAGVPVFTVNYDTMLEDACDVLGISDYKVVARTPTTEDLRYPGLLICKLHGSIPRDGGSVSSTDIRTTMESISQKNHAWLKYMFEQMGLGRHLCFVGYSGRDFDYCQSIIDRLMEDASLPRPFWLMSAGSDADPSGAPRRFADRMGATRIAEYPDAVFPRLVVDVARSLPYSLGDALIVAAHAVGPGVDATGMTKLLDRLKAGSHPLTKGQQELLWALILLRTGLNEECLRQLGHLESVYGRGFEGIPDEWARECLLSAVMMARREVADFSGYRVAAKSYGRFVRRRIREGSGDGALTALFNARLQVISSSYMRIPSNLGYPVPFPLQRPLVFVTTLLRMEALNVRLSGVLSAYPGDSSLVPLSQEARVRTLAAYCKLHERFGVPSRGWMVRKLSDLRGEAEGIGNYITALGVEKYLNRLGFVASGETIGMQGGMLDLKSELSIAHRDSGEYGKAIDEAKKNGNTLNLIKAYFQLARHREMEEGRLRPLLEASELVELDDAIMKVTPPGLRLTLRYIRRRHV